MTTFLVLAIILLVIILLAFLYLAHTLGKLTAAKSASLDPESKTIDEITIFDWKSKGLILLSLALLILSFFTPFLLTRMEVTTTPNFTATGQIGDTIGGLMNPFIAMAGVFVTGLAFYIQFKANQLQRVLFQKQIDHQNEQVKLQQFESQFYEMLKLHRDNVTEMNIEGYDFRKTINGLEKFEKATEGRKVFVTMKAELECILTCFANGGKLNKDLFNKSYKLFFSGLDDYSKNNSADAVFTGLLEKGRERHQYPLTSVTTNEERKRFLTGANMDFNYKPFSGHASRLGHYFRHLYLAVKNVVQSKVVSDYDEKMKYLKILRAQLSNHEQMLLFYNWLSSYGENWENDTNHFFTEYRMIHNLWHDNLMKNEFIDEQVDVLRNTKVSHEDPIFEIDPVPVR
jgi:hypothetical protein